MSMRSCIGGSALEDRKQIEVRLMVRLGIINQLMTTRLGKLFVDVELNPSQFGVLNHFTHEPHRSWMVTELADVMEMNQPGITKIVSLLSSKGLLDVQEDELDKRKRRLKITSKGIQLCNDVIKTLLPDIAHTFDSWDDEKLSELYHHMDQLMRWLDEHRDDIKRS